MLLPRRRILQASIAAPFVLSRRAAAQSVLLSAPGGAGPDALTIMLAGMVVGQWKRISGAVGDAANNATTPFTRANYDAYGIGAFGTFASAGAGIGTLNAGNLFSFSKGAISVPRRKIMSAGGGHAAYEDGSFRLFDILAACAAVNAGGSGAWTVAAKTGKMTPVSDPKPADSDTIYNASLTSTTATGTSGTNTVTVASAAGINQFDYIGTGLAPSAIPAGTNVQSIVGTTLTLSNNLAGNLSGTTVQFGPEANFWSGSSAAGQTMPVPCHTYHGCNFVPGTTKSLFGGTFGDFSNAAWPGIGYVLDDSLPDGSNVFRDTHAYPKGYFDSTPSDFCDLDSSNNFYVWRFFTATLERFNAPFPTSGAPTVLASGLSVIVPGANCEGLIIPDAVNGNTKRMFFTHVANTTSLGGFGVILNMFPAAGATYSNQKGTYLNNPATFWTLQNGGENLALCYNSDLGAIVVLDCTATAGAGQMQSVTINASLQATIANLFTTPTGDLPAANSNAYPRIAYDAAHKCYFVQQWGDVYVAKAA